MKNFKYIDSKKGEEEYLSSYPKETQIIMNAKKDIKPIFLETHDSNPRLVAQSGIFEICRFPESKANVEKLKEFHQEVLKNSINKIYVIHKDKFDVLKEILRRKRINRAKLFPDLQNICKYVSETV